MTKVETKACRHCKEIKNIDVADFYKSKVSKDGYASWCITCTRENAKKYAAKNKKKVKEYRYNYYHSHKEEALLKNAVWVKNNPDKIEIYKATNRGKQRTKTLSEQRKYYTENKVRIQEIARRYAKNNPERIREYKRNWKKSNKEKLRQDSMVIAENKKSGSYSRKDWERTIEYFDGTCAYCGSSDKKLNKEHIIPISKGGSYTPDNILPACAQCNSSKWRHDMYEWYSKKEFFSKERLQRINEYVVRKSAV